MCLYVYMVKETRLVHQLHNIRIRCRPVNILEAYRKLGRTNHQDFVELAINGNHRFILREFPFKSPGLVLVGIALGSALVKGAVAIVKKIRTVVEETREGGRFVLIDDAIIVEIITLRCHSPERIAHHLRFGDGRGQHGQRFAPAPGGKDCQGYYPKNCFVTERPHS